MSFEKLGPGEPLLGMSTTKYRVTQDYKLAMKVALMNRNSTEHIVQEYWMADQKKRLRQSVRAHGRHATRVPAVRSAS